jgi:hypothetical protein
VTATFDPVAWYVLPTGAAYWRAELAPCRDCGESRFAILACPVPPAEPTPDDPEPAPRPPDLRTGCPHCCTWPRGSRRVGTFDVLTLEWDEWPRDGRGP